MLHLILMLTWGAVALRDLLVIGIPLLLALAGYWWFLKLTGCLCRLASEEECGSPLRGPPNPSS